MGRWLAIGGIVFLVALTVGLSQADVTKGRVVRIVDGDTIVVEGQGVRQKVRLSGIDTPERDQPWGDSSTREMRRLVAGKDVTVPLVQDRSMGPTDRERVRRW